MNPLSHSGTGQERAEVAAMVGLRLPLRHRRGTIWKMHRTAMAAPLINKSTANTSPGQPVTSPMRSPGCFSPAPGRLARPGLGRNAADLASVRAIDWNLPVPQYVVGATLPAVQREYPSWPRTQSASSHCSVSQPSQPAKAPTFRVRALGPAPATSSTVQQAATVSPARPSALLAARSATTSHRATANNHQAALSRGAVVITRPSGCDTPVAFFGRGLSRAGKDLPTPCGRGNRDIPLAVTWRNQRPKEIRSCPVTSNLSLLSQLSARLPHVVKLPGNRRSGAPVPARPERSPSAPTRSPAQPWAPRVTFLSARAARATAKADTAAKARRSRAIGARRPGGPLTFALKRPLAGETTFHPFHEAAAQTCAGGLFHGRKGAQTPVPGRSRGGHACSTRS